MLNKVEYKGYHATNSESAKDILDNGFEISKLRKREDHWLGIGFYFFQNVSDAESWSKTAHYCKKSPSIIECDLICDENEFLDLDNPTSYNKFIVYFREVLDNLANVKKLDFKSTHHAMHFGLSLYKYEKNTKLIKRTFENTRTANALSFTNLGINLQYQYTEVQLCASSADIIYNKKVI